MKKLLWICCYDSNYPWGAEVAMLDGFKKSGEWTIEYVDYRMCKAVGIDLYNVIKRKSKNADAILIQRGENLDYNKIYKLNKPLFYFATEGGANEDQTAAFGQLVGKVNKIFARKLTKESAVMMGHSSDDVIEFTLPYNHIQYNNKGVGKAYDVILGGTITPRREKIYNKIIEEVNKFGAAGYTNESGAACSDIYNIARCVVNIHAYDVLDTEVRIFEVMSTSALLITEELADDIPSKGKFLTFDNGNIDECIGHIKWIKDNDKKVAAMIKDANRYALDNSWDTKADDMLRVIGDNL